MNGADIRHMQDERRAACARIAHLLNQAHNMLQLAGCENNKFALNIELPPARPLVDAINEVAKKAKGETPL